MTCDITPRPLIYPLEDYHNAPGKGPLHATWQDKPHRVVYDLVAALAAKDAEIAALVAAQGGTAVHEAAQPYTNAEMDSADALRFADAIDPFTRSKAPDHLTMACAAKVLRALAQAVQA